MLLFEELFPFGGKLDENNRWLKIGMLIPWDQFENSYCQHFSHTGRPAIDARMVIGLLLLKRKIIKAKGMLIDATVFPENIRFPTDAGLLNEARHWLVSKIRSIGGKLGKKCGTYCRPGAPGISGIQQAETQDAEGY